MSNFTKAVKQRINNGYDNINHLSLVGLAQTPASYVVAGGAATNALLGSGVGAAYGGISDDTSWTTGALYGAGIGGGLGAGLGIFSKSLGNNFVRGLAKTTNPTQSTSALISQGRSLRTGFWSGLKETYNQSGHLL